MKYDDIHIQKEYDVVIKKRPPTSPDEFNLFGKEGNAYMNIIPDFKNFIHEKSNVGYLLDMFPKCYYAAWDDNEKFIVLEDVSVLGYEVKPVYHAFDYNHTRLLLNRLARFHAVSFAFKSKHPLQERYGKYLEDLYVAMRSRLFELYTTSGFSTSIDMLKKVPGYEDKTTFFESVFSNLSKFWDEMLQPSEPLAVLCHGDLWTANLLWKYENGVVNDVNLIDLQVFRYGNPSLDISNFLCICVDSKVLKNHFDELIKCYYDEFQSTLNLLKYDNQSFSLQNLYEDYKKYGRWGLVCGFQWLPLMLSNIDRTQDLSKDFEKIDNKNNILQQRLCSLIDFYQERGFV